MNIDNMYGYPININDDVIRSFNAPRQFKFPRSKKKRIRNKWENNPLNFRKKQPEVYAIRVGDRFYVSSEVYKQLKEATNKIEQEVKIEREHYGSVS
jgi:hypothetical protein